MKMVVVGLYCLLPMALCAQPINANAKGYGALFFPVSKTYPGEVTIAGYDFKFSQEMAETTIEEGLARAVVFAEELKAADSEKKMEDARLYLERSYRELAYAIIAVEMFGSKTDRLFSLLQEVKDKLSAVVVPRSVITPRQFYLAMGRGSFANKDGYPMEFGEITDRVTFSDLVIEARDQITFRGGLPKE